MKRGKNKRNLRRWVRYIGKQDKTLPGYWKAFDKVHCPGTRAGSRTKLRVGKYKASREDMQRRKRMARIYGVPFRYLGSYGFDRGWGRRKK